ncbi:MAG TPA: response regulator, partial [Pseudorhizobium sp.]|nr:response regulator [Pseudorhizobium sp.]
KKIANALEAVGRGAKLASQLLAFGRRQPLEPKVVNIGRFVSGMEELLRRTIGEEVEVETIRSGGLWNTFIDIVQFENAILNLAINARDAMDGRGKLTIEVGNAFLDDEYARQHDDVEAGQYVMLAVSDTGSGIAPEVMAKVFDPFFTTKPVGKGTGLGLSMVYGFVKQSGGHIKIYSEIGEGTTIKVYFPRSHQQEDMVTAIDHGPVIGGTETVLVAEDDEQVRDTVVAMLSDLGYKVLKAKDAAAALTIIESGVPVDLLFTDVVMPGPLKSSEMARQARERMPELAVLFTSGYTENSIVHGGRLDPGVDLLSKPYTRESMARKIRHVLNNRKQVIKGLELQNEDRPVKSSPALPPAEAPTKRVLLVEDNDLIRMSTADMLVELGCAVVEASSAEEALSLLEREQVDILVSDLGLPGMGGDELCCLVRQRWPKIAIIFATGMDKGPELEDGARTALLPKPHGLEELSAALAAVMAQG